MIVVNEWVEILLQVKMTSEWIKRGAGVFYIVIILNNNLIIIKITIIIKYNNSTTYYVVVFTKSSVCTNVIKRP